jgi:flagellar hook assembly protein FlgD
MSEALAGIGLRAAGPPGVPERRQTLGQEDFLTLLTAQLRNQNPLSPLDNEAFVAQLAQFSTVSGITEMNRSLERLLDLARRRDSAGAPQWLGRHVSSAGVSGTVTAVRLDPSGPILTIDGRADIPLAAVTAVSARPAPDGGNNP